MKRFFYIALALVCLASCQKAPFLTMTGSHNYNFTDHGGTQSFSFSCNREWRASASDSWIRISPSSGEASKEEITVTITCESNTTYEDRNCTISIIAEDLNETISVSQEQNKGIVMISEKSISVDAAGGDFSIEYKTNDVVSVVINDNAKKWIEVLSGPSTKSLHDEFVKFRIYPTDSYELRAADIQLVTTENKKETISVSQKGKDPINLCSKGTANSYIVPLTTDKYSFNATVRGNGNVVIEGGASASIVWEFENRDSGKKTIVKNVSYDKDKGTISFYPSGTPGNALVALKDASGAILWSWHLWCFNYDEDNGFHTINGYKLMDRNLGAIDKRDAGFAYQWGRKDPFPIYFQGASIDYAYCTTPDIGSVDYAAAHPTTIIRASTASYHPTSGSGGHWLAAENYTNLWGGGKTSNDPCPPGWKVISNGYLVMKDIPTGVFSTDDEGFVYFEEPYCVPKMLLPKVTLFSANGQSKSEGSSFFVWTCRSYWKGELGEEFSISNNWLYPYGASGTSAEDGRNVRCQRVY